MAILSDGQLDSFAEAGFVVLSGLVSAAGLDLVDREIDRLVAAEPPPAGHAGPFFYWRSPHASPDLFAPLGGILAAAGELVGAGGVGVAFEQAQVALNVPPYSHRPGRHHLDGYHEGEPPATFTMLAGLLLVDETEDDTGNLWVWPGTHRTHAAYFAADGPEAFNRDGGYPGIDLPEPVQVHGRRGDVLLAHYLLGHNIGGNYRSDRIRRVVYWRLRAEGHADHWKGALVDEWLEYGAIRARAADPSARSFY